MNTQKHLDKISAKYGFCVARDLAKNKGLSICEHCASASIVTISEPGQLCLDCQNQLAFDAIIEAAETDYLNK